MWLLAFISFAQDDFKFGDDFQILRAACGALDFNQLLQIDAKARDTKQFDRDAVGQQFIETSSTRYFSQEINIS